MPGAGKSTLGVLLAKRMAYGFVDVDLLIQEALGGPLREIIARRGVAEFLRIEERTLLSLDCANYVIATGGSAVYSAAAMEHLRNIATVVHLDAPLETLRERLGDLSLRGVIRSEGQSFEELFAERRPLYERWADLRIDCRALQHDAAVTSILSALAER